MTRLLCTHFKQWKAVFEMIKYFLSENLVMKKISEFDELPCLFIESLLENATVKAIILQGLYILISQ